MSLTQASERAFGLVVTLSPDPSYGLLAHDPRCAYIEGVPSMPLATPSLDVDVVRHDCLLDEHGRLTV